MRNDLDSIKDMKVKDIFTEFKKVKLDPDDIIIFETTDKMMFSESQYEYLKSSLEQSFDNKILLLDKVTLAGILQKEKVDE